MHSFKTCTLDITDSTQNDQPTNDLISPSTIAKYILDLDIEEEKEQMAVDNDITDMAWD